MLKINVKKLPKSLVEIEGEMDKDLFESYFKRALERVGANVEVAGFRKGKVPENLLLSKIPEMHILEEMAELALTEHYPKILEEHKIDAISSPKISITKIARGNPFEFKITTVTMPDIKLPDYKKIAKEEKAKLEKDKKEIIVTEQEVEDTIMDIRKSRAQREHMAKYHNEDGSHKEPHSHEGEDALPEFNDEFVQALGPFKDIADFKEKLKENIKLEKIAAEKEKVRLKIIEKIIEDTEIEIPEILIEAELGKIIFRMESDVSAMGMKFDDYLTHIKKTREDLKKEFAKDAEKKAKLAIILAEIAKQEKIEPDHAQVKKEVAMIMEHYKDADPERARAHTENVLTNEKIFQFLESQ